MWSCLINESPNARALALQTIKKQFSCLYREDFLAVQAALRSACAAPADEPLTATGEWLEERRLLSRSGASHSYISMRWLDDTGHEHGHLLCAGTLAEYQAAPIGKPALQGAGDRQP